METKLIVQGMTCEMCVKHVKQGLENVPGVQSAVVDLTTNTATVQSADVDADILIEAVQEEGYDAYRAH
jgi:copper chaperone CopZ